MTLIISLKNFYHITCFIFLYFSIFSHPKSIIELIQNPVSISTIPYIVFMTQFLLFLKEYKNNNLNLKFKNNNKSLIIIIALFFSQLTGILNAYLNNKFIFNSNNLEPTYYLTSISAYILLLLNNKKNYFFLSKANIIQIAILILISLTFILHAKNISYGASVIKIKLELLNFEKEYIANSNGLGRINLILAILFLLISISKNKLSIYFFVISILFGGITLAYEGKFNFLLFIILTIYIIFKSNYKNKIYLFISYIFLSLTIYLVNFNLNKNSILLEKEIKNFDTGIRNLESNSYRIINIQTNNDPELVNLIKTHPNYKYFQHFIENEHTKKINSILTGRLNKLIFFFLYNENFFLGTGPMSDRIISIIHDYKINNDSASAITYTYLASGISGLILLFCLYYNLVKIFFSVKIEKIPFNINFVKSLILLIILRSLVENSFSVWGIDFCVLLLSIFTIQYCSKKINENSS